MSDVRIAVIGLGYVGLPLAVALSAKFPVVGFDVSADRIAELREGRDRTGEIDTEALSGSSLRLTDDIADSAGCNLFIVTVPTPVDDANRPDFGPVLSACQLVGSILAPGSIVVFESTVYPGATEDICGPALEHASGLRVAADFQLGYSPERINPGDREHGLADIVKIVSAEDEDTLETLAEVYGSVVSAGIHRASSIKVAEAAKVIENTQRDINIALMNELSKICDLVDIRTSEVLEAAGTKWNFVRFHPGLVGGHCIGVDPYYLTAKAEEVGYRPEVILAGRRINDGMGAYVAQKVLKLLAASERSIGGARVGILGLTFKPNVPDIRNSKVLDICRELRAFGIEPLAHDPHAPAGAVRQEFGIELASLDAFSHLDALILAVPHEEYRSFGSKPMAEMMVEGGIVADLMSVLNPADLRRDLVHWSL